MTSAPFFHSEPEFLSKADQVILPFARLTYSKLLDDARRRYPDLFDDVTEDDCVIDALLVSLSHSVQRANLSVDDVPGMFTIAKKAYGDFSLKYVNWICERRRHCTEQNNAVQLYFVVNASDKRVDVLARSFQCAAWLATEARHLQWPNVARVKKYRVDFVEREFRVGSAMYRAVKEHVPGVIKVVGGSVIIERAGKVYMTFGVVEQQ